MESPDCLIIVSVAERFKTMIGKASDFRTPTVHTSVMVNLSTIYFNSHALLSIDLKD